MYLNERTKKLFYYGLFACAMAYVESAVVVYLRKIYYPQGFAFPLKQIESSIALVEIGREAATLIMLVTIAIAAYKKFKNRFALFVYLFALWDLFYYFWLKVFLNWPKGFGDWDVLFLIPAPWVAPWTAPAIVSVALIFASVTILLFEEKFPPGILSSKEWLLEILAALLILFTFFTNSALVLKGGLPTEYDWLVFSIGVALGLIVFVRRLLG